MEMEKYTIKRDGLPPIAFTGALIGSGSSRSNDNWSWTNVAIYQTRGGRFVAAVEGITCYEGGRDSYSATSLPTAAEVVEWLKKDSGELGRVSQEAVEDAAENSEAFAAEWVEEVE